MEPETFATILGLVESDGNLNAPLGDDGRAAGRFQIHPDFLWEWAFRLKVQPKLNERWDSFYSRLVQAFFTFPFHLKLLPVEVAMTFHMGHIVRRTDPLPPDWDRDYENKWIIKSKQVTPPAA